jgi:hypothetical protein
MTIMGFKKKNCKDDMSAWHKKVWKVFSQYVRMRDSDHLGGCSCISCGRYGQWYRMDAGHYISRGHKFLLYNELNVNAQCKRCNAFLQGNASGYRMGLDKKYGIGTADNLDAVKDYPAGFTKDGLKMMYDEYSEKVKQLKKECL